MEPTKGTTNVSFFSNIKNAIAEKVNNLLKKDTPPTTDKTASGITKAENSSEVTGSLKNGANFGLKDGILTITKGDGGEKFEIKAFVNDYDEKEINCIHSSNTTPRKEIFNENLRLFTELSPMIHEIAQKNPDALNPDLIALFEGQPTEYPAKPEVFNPSANFVNPYADGVQYRKNKEQ